MSFITIQLRHDNSTNWSTANTVLANGEFGYVTDTQQIFVGDGVSAYTNLNGTTAFISTNALTLNGHSQVFYTNATNINTGLLPNTQLGSGTANNTTYLRGDRTWATISTGSTVAGANTDVQFNDSGVLNGVDAFAFNKVTGTLSIGNTTVNTQINATSVTGTILNANNSSYLGGIISSNYQTIAGLGANVATLTANNASNFNGQPASFYANASNITSGTLGTARLGSGTANSTTYLRGDQTWATVSGGSGTPSGSNTDIQFNDSTSFGGNDFFTFNKTTTTMSIGNSTVNTQINSTSLSTFINTTGAFVFSGVHTHNANLALIGNTTGELLIGNTAANIVSNATTITISTNSTVLATVNSTIFSGTSSNATNLNSQPGSFYTNATNIATGTVPTARLGSGTANTTTWLRGDNSWQTITAQVPNYTTYANLRSTGSGVANGTVVFVQGASSIADGGQGFFESLGAAGNSDDGGVYIVATSTVFKRLFNNEYNVQWWGCGLGDGSTNCSNTFQACINAVSTSFGGGRIFIPNPTIYYAFTNALLLFSNIELYGDQPRLVQTNTTGGQTIGLPGVLFMPGNFHPGFTQNITQANLAFSNSGSTYYSTGTITDGDYKVTLTTASQANNFSVNDQVLIVSNTYFYEGFEVQDYGWLNVVTSTNTTSGVIGLRYQLDQTLPSGQISNLKNNLGRSANLFFSENVILNNLRIENNTSNAQLGWITDSATKNCKFKDLVVYSRVGAYGNMYQDTLWENCTFYFADTASEMSCLSLRTDIINCKFISYPVANIAQTGAHGIQECSRYINHINCLTEWGSHSPNTGPPAIRFSHCSHSRMSGGAMRGIGWSGGDWLYIGGVVNDTAGTTSNTTIFPIIDNVIENVKIDSSGSSVVSRWAHLDGSNTITTDANGIRNCRFSGTVGANGTAIWSTGNVGRNFFIGNQVLTPNAYFQSTDYPGSFPVNFQLIDNYIDGGFAANNSSVELQGNIVRGNYSNNWYQALNAKSFLNGLQNIPNGNTIVVYTSNVTSFSEPTSIEFQMAFARSGTTNTSFIFNFFNSANSFENDVWTYTMPDSSSNYNLKAKIDWIGSGFYVFSIQVSDSLANTNFYSSTINSVPAANNDLNFRIKCVGSANGSVELYMLTANVSNPFFA